MTKWVENKDVKFTCQQDIWRHLVDGGAIKSNFLNSSVHLFDHGKLNIAGFSYNNPDEWIPMKRAEWYEDIPNQGVLCWINDKQVSLIRSYNNGWFYAANGMHKEAIPLTQEEVMQYILPE